jgi:hypothetical protein
LVEQGMEELDQLELAVDELMQGMKDLDQLELIVDEVLQWMEGMEELTSWSTPSTSCCRGWRSSSRSSTSVHLPRCRGWRSLSSGSLPSM